MHKRCLPKLLDTRYCNVENRKHTLAFLFFVLPLVRLVLFGEFSRIFWKDRHWKAGCSVLKSWLFEPKRWLFSRNGEFSARKMTFQPKRWLFSRKGEFSAEKVTLQPKRWLFNRKGEFSAEKVTFQPEKALFCRKHDFSAEKRLFSV